MDTKYFKLAIRFVVTSVLLALVFWRIDLQQFWQAVRSARREYFVMAWAASMAFFVVRSYRLRLILKQQSLDVGAFTIFKISAATALYSARSYEYRRQMVHTKESHRKRNKHL